MNVRCDDTTTTADDVAACLLHLPDRRPATHPAEFVTVRIAITQGASRS